MWAEFFNLVFLTNAIFANHALESCDKPITSLEKTVQFSNSIFKEQDENVWHELFEEIDRSDKLAAHDKYYKTASKTLQSHCNILKSFGGRWAGGCGFLDGAKMVCMDSLYKAVKNGTCLVYSFGLSDDWDFEIFMATLGCTVRAFDPTTNVVIPPEAQQYPTLHYYKMGISEIDGEAEVYTDHSVLEVIKVKTLKTLIKENGDSKKRITYFKSDVEGTELFCMKNWLKSGVLANIDQIGIEMHTTGMNIQKNYEKKVLKSILKFMQELATKWNFYLVHYNPNLCQGKSLDRTRTFYTHHDFLFVKDSIQN